ncbi:fungal-specific transcription factor domain-containing protein [Roridomyces roridus]|uniref:Fungal-specific transcription factor domain-containing protein n=1 Tax=Roridomyces roridus TaxID=1738132 RepID=A0AAD7B653_9AGAR|nr:fungal-specific transcription factor domain-containing protein [Roridomyces roridus]
MKISHCRKRKIKCNRSYPCAPCILRGENESCREVDKIADIPPKTVSENIDDLLHRVATLEAAVLKLTSPLPPDEPGHLPTPCRSPAAATQPAPSTIRSSFGTNTTDEDVAMMLEVCASSLFEVPLTVGQDFAMGHRVNQTRATQDLEAVPYSDETRSPRVEAPQLGVPRGHPLALLIDPTTNVMSKLLASLGLLPEEQTSTLIQFYFDRLDWYSKVMHKQSFIAESEELIRNVASRKISAIRVGFLALHYMVLCLALHLIEPAIREQLEISFEAASELAKNMYSAAQACIYYDEFIGSHSLEHVQCIILMGLYQQNLDESDAHWALLGTAIKIAQNLGISRLGSEGDGRQYSAAWRSVVKREVARRVWWLLIWDDWSQAAAHNGSYSIHPSQNHTGLPANINDADLVDGKPFAPQPPHVYTEMTFSLCRLRFVELYRQILDNMQAPTGYSFVIDMDRTISSTMADVPSHFNGAGAGTKTFELTLALIMGETRRLRLHRPYLFRGYKDRKYIDSRVQCVKSATAILNYLKSDGESTILLKWWVTLFYGFAAAEGQPDLETRRVQLREALDLFKTAEHISAVSRNAIALLDGLLAVEPTMSSQPSRKRAAPDDEPFERVVKRLIIDASRNLTIPGNASSHSSGSDLGSHSVRTSMSSSPVNSFAGHASGNDLFVSGALFRDEGMFSGPQFDEQTMAQISQLLYNDPYGFLDGGQ